MKAIFCLPAHPSNFDNQYTREEIDEAKLDIDTSEVVAETPFPRPSTQENI